MKIVKLTKRWETPFQKASEEERTLKPGGHEDQSPRNLLNKGGKFIDGEAIIATVGFSYEF